VRDSVKVGKVVKTFKRVIGFSMNLV